MRFHVLNNELDAWHEQKEKEHEAKAKNKGEESKDAQESDEEEDEMTAAKLFNQKIIERANIGQFAGEIVCSI